MPKSELESEAEAHRIEAPEPNSIPRILITLRLKSHPDNPREQLSHLNNPRHEFLDVSTLQTTRSAGFRGIYILDNCGTKCPKCPHLNKLIGEIKCGRNGCSRRESPFRAEDMAPEETAEILKELPLFLEEGSDYRKTALSLEKNSSNFRNIGR